MELKLDELKIVGKGATSDVYYLDDNRVLKLFKNDYKKEAVDYEAYIAKEINNLKIKSPKFIEQIETNNRFGIIYENIKGSLLFDELLKKKNVVKIVKELVRNQIEINSHRGINLPKQNSRFKDQINRTNLNQEIKNKLFNILESIPEENFVCHGDYHVGNIIRTENGLITIDWMNSYLGNIETDIIRTILMFETPYIPLKLNPFNRFLFNTFKAKVKRIYKKEIFREFKIKNYKKWLVLVAAVRLSDNIPQEEKWLKGIIKRNLKRL